MPRCTVTLSGNAGAVLELNLVRIWLDLLHTQKTENFSTVGPELQRRMLQCEAFAHPDLIFFTHCHPDHYSRTLTGQALKLWPDAKLVLPQQEFARQITLSRPVERLDLPGCSVRFGRLPHEGAQYAGVPHYGCVIEAGGFTALIAGDCEVASPLLAQLIGDTPIDLALLDFPWVTLRKGREFLEREIRPRHLLVFHLPFAGDDRAGYRAAAARMIGRLEGIPDVRLLQDPLQREEILSPS